MNDGGTISALEKVIEYDNMLRNISRMSKDEVILSGEMPKLDAAYDLMVSSAILALSSARYSQRDVTASGELP